MYVCSEEEFSKAWAIHEKHSSGGAASVGEKKQDEKNEVETPTPVPPSKRGRGAGEGGTKPPKKNKTELDQLLARCKTMCNEYNSACSNATVTLQSIAETEEWSWAKGLSDPLQQEPIKSNSGAESHNFVSKL